MDKLSVFDFSDYRSYLRSRIVDGTGAGGKKRISLDRLAEKLGYKSPSSLSMILKGDRAPSANLLQELMDHWRLTPPEREYFRLLVQLESAKKKNKDTKVLVDRLQKLNRKPISFQFSIEDFEHLRDWHFLVIKELAYTVDFRDDPLWISKRLRRKITPSQAKHALEVLEKLSVLTRDSAGNLVPNKGLTETTNDVPSHAIRQHHKGMLLRASEAMDEQPSEKRQITGLTLRVDPAKLPEMKQQIMHFIRTFHADNEADSQSVYQLSVQFFEHTKLVNENAMNRGDDETFQ